MEDIESLLGSLSSLDQVELAEAIRVLYYFVKEHEGEEQIRPIEEALPNLCKYLLFEGPHLIMERMSSIFRRVPINRVSIQEIMSLHKQTPNGNLISVLYSVGVEKFTTEVQDFIINTLQDFPDEAIHVFCGNCHGTLTPGSLDALYTHLQHILDFQKDNHNISSKVKGILYILCHQTYGENYNQTIEMLLVIFPKLDKEYKLEAITYLSLFSKNMGFPIFKVTATDNDIDIKLETVKSLERIIALNPPKAQSSDRLKMSIELLIKLTSDENRLVADAAINALKNNHLPTS